MFGLPPLPARIERDIQLGKAFAVALAIVLLAVGALLGALATRFIRG